MNGVYAQITVSTIKKRVVFAYKVKTKVVELIQNFCSAT